MLREAVEAVRGESLKFERDLLRSTTEMGRMVEIEDIRELKRALTREMHTIRTAVADRQKSEATHYETLTSRVQTLEQSLVRARAEAATDALTQLPNRGAFDVAVREWVAGPRTTARCSPSRWSTSMTSSASTTPTAIRSAIA